MSKRQLEPDFHYNNCLRSESRLWHQLMCGGCGWQTSSTGLPETARPKPTDTMSLSRTPATAPHQWWWYTNQIVAPMVTIRQPHSRITGDGTATTEPHQWWWYRRQQRWQWPEAAVSRRVPIVSGSWEVRSAMVSEGNSISGAASLPSVRPSEARLETNGFWTVGAAHFHFARVSSSWRVEDEKESRRFYFEKERPSSRCCPRLPGFVGRY